MRPTEIITSYYKQYEYIPPETSAKIHSKSVRISVIGNLQLINNNDNNSEDNKIIVT